MSVKRPQLIHWIGTTCVFCCQISIGRNKRKQTTEIFENQVSQWCPLCSRWRHRRLSLWQPPVPTMTIKSASCQPLVLRAVFSTLDAALSELSITQQQRSYITLIHVRAPAQPQEADKALHSTSQEYVLWIYALLALWAGNSPVTGEFPSQRPVTRSFDVFFDLRLIRGNNAVKQIIETPVIWDAMALIMTSL